MFRTTYIPIYFYFFILFSTKGWAEERIDIFDMIYAKDFFEEPISNTTGFSLDGELGFVYTSGNTQSSSINGRLEAEHDTDSWSNRYRIESLYSRSRNQQTEAMSATTAQRFNMRLEADYKLVDPNKRIFVFADYDDNRFDGFDYQGSIVSGWAAKMLFTNTSSFRCSVGPGYDFSQRSEKGQSNPQGWVVRASAEYLLEWTSGARLRQFLSTAAGNANTRSRSETSISANVIDSLAMKLTFQMDHNSEPGDNNASLNTETSIALVYQFF